MKLPPQRSIKNTISLLTRIALIATLPPIDSTNPCSNCDAIIGERCIAFPYTTLVSGTQSSANNNNLDDETAMTSTIIIDSECDKCTGLVGTDNVPHPCTIPHGACYCWNAELNPLKIPPAPSSGYDHNNNNDADDTTSLLSPCNMLTEPLFQYYFAPNAQHPYTYQGLCDAIQLYNTNHHQQSNFEQVFQMGSAIQIKSEFAAFLGHTFHMTGGYTQSNDVLTCGDHVTMLNDNGEEERYCKPCESMQDFDLDSMTCSTSMIANGQSMASYCDVNVRDDSDWSHGCECQRNLEEVQLSPLMSGDGDALAGYFMANEDYFGRGAMLLRWNEDYLKASIALTGSSDRLCESPDLVALDPLYAWGSALYHWMEKMGEEEGKTSHIHALEGSLGGTLQIIDGDRSCNPSSATYNNNRDGIKLFLDAYCHAAVTLRATEILSMDGCEGLQEVYDECLEDGSCDTCQVFEDLKVGTGPTLAPVLSGGNGVPSVDDGNLNVGNPSPSPTELVNESTTSPTSIAPVATPAVESATEVPSLPSVDTSKPSMMASMRPSTVPTMSPMSLPSTTSPTLSSEVETPSPTASTEYLPCIGAPCANSDNCRSSKGICGEGVVFCNGASLWTAECIASSSPSISPVASPIAPLPSGTTPMASPSSNATFISITKSPTTASIESDNSSPRPTPPFPFACTGKPCTEPQSCRNQFNFCGTGQFFCNSDSVWSPTCSLSSSSSSSSSSVPTLQPANITVQPTNQLTGTPTKAPEPAWWGVVFDEKNGRPVSNARNSGVAGFGEKQLNLFGRGTASFHNIIQLVGIISIFGTVIF